MINIPKFFKQDESGASALVLPLMPLRDIVVFPHMVVPLFVGRAKSVSALTEAMKNDKLIFLAAQRDAAIDEPGEKDINRVGTVCSVLQLLRLPDGTVKALVEGKIRACIRDLESDEGFFQAELEPVAEIPVSPAEGEALSREIVDKFTEYARLDKGVAKELVHNLAIIAEASKLGDTVAASFSFKISDKQQLLEINDLQERLLLLLELIHNEIDIFRVTQ